MPTEEEIAEEIENLRQQVESKTGTQPADNKGAIVGAAIAAGLIAATSKPTNIQPMPVPTRDPIADKITTVKPGHSGTEKILKGTKYLQPGEFQGKTIKSVLKDGFENKRVVEFTDGTRVSSSKQIVRAHIDVELDKVYKPKALRTIKVAKDGSAKVRLGGVKEGEFVKYSSKANAKRAVDDYYSEDLEKYKEQRYPKRCRKGSKIIRSSKK